MATDSTTDTTPETVLSLTPAAVAKVAALVSQEPDSKSLALRVGVVPGGCSGFSYEMFFDSTVAEGDSLLSLSDDVRVVVDAESAPMLRGATLDYTDGLTDAGFHLDNPNAKSSCGCGESFS